MPMYGRFHAWSEDGFHVSRGVLFTSSYRQRTDGGNTLAT